MLMTYPFIASPQRKKETNMMISFFSSATLNRISLLSFVLFTGVSLTRCRSISMTLIWFPLLLVATHPSEMHCTLKSLQKNGADKPMKLEIKQHQEVVVLSEMAP